jgi:F-type H+-transporting ATPase subunit epsilon
MPPKTLKFDLVTPERQVLSQDVEEVVLPGAAGSFGVLPGHEPLVSALQPGMLKFKTDGVETLYAIGGGYVEVTQDKVVALADSADRADEIDVAAARQAQAKAQAQLKQGVRGAEMDLAEISLKKALAQLQVAQIVRRRSSRAGT